MIFPVQAWFRLKTVRSVLLQVNVEKVLERDQKLSQLDDRADALQVILEIKQY